MVCLYHYQASSGLTTVISNIAEFARDLLNQQVKSALAVVKDLWADMKYMHFTYFILLLFSTQTSAEVIVAVGAEPIYL